MPCTQSLCTGMLWAASPCLCRCVCVTVMPQCVVCQPYWQEETMKALSGGGLRDSDSNKRRREEANDNCMDSCDPCVNFHAYAYIYIYIYMSTCACTYIFISVYLPKCAYVFIHVARRG